jgi:hypothetical protein
LESILFNSRVGIGKEKRVNLVLFEERGEKEEKLWETIMETECAAITAGLIVDLRTRLRILWLIANRCFLYLYSVLSGGWLTLCNS